MDSIIDLIGRYKSVEATAARLHRCRRSVERLIAAGKLQAVRPNRRCVLIPEDAITQFEQERDLKS
jgi:excisionase family DNA binding protein